jgi:GDP-L-fucose synthase
LRKGGDEVVVWGSGEPRREFLHVSDLANGLVFLMQNYQAEEIINVGAGTDVTIRELADMIKRASGFNGSIRFDRTKPDGTPRKLLDSGRIADLGWRPSVSLQEGISETWNWYSEHSLGRRDLLGVTAR